MKQKKGSPGQCSPWLEHQPAHHRAAGLIPVKGERKIYTRQTTHLGELDFLGHNTKGKSGFQKCFFGQHSIFKIFDVVIKI